MKGIVGIVLVQIALLAAAGWFIIRKKRQGKLDMGFVVALIMVAFSIDLLVLTVWLVLRILPG